MQTAVLRSDLITTKKMEVLGQLAADGLKWKKSVYFDHLDFMWNMLTVL